MLRFFGAHLAQLSLLMAKVVRLHWSLHLSVSEAPADLPCRQTGNTRESDDENENENEKEYAFPGQMNRNSENLSEKDRTFRSDAMC